MAEQPQEFKYQAVQLATFRAALGHHQPWNPDCICFASHFVSSGLVRVYYGLRMLGWSSCSSPVRCTPPVDFRLMGLERKPVPAVYPRLPTEMTTNIAMLPSEVTRGSRVAKVTRKR